MKTVTSLFLAALLLVSFASAQRFTLPENAREVAPGVYSLGQSIHNGKVVDGIAFVDYAYDAKSARVGAKPSSCYAFLARGAKWKSVEPWILNPTNNQSLSASFLQQNVADDIAKWESASGKDILGTGTVDASLVADTGVMDGKNTIGFGHISSQGAIAVTTVWGTFSGPASVRELVEWDQVYDTEDYAWSTSGEAGKMDFENIATHELGHAVGMGHPSGGCTEETMYAYASFGETKKRTLNTGDMAGIFALYG
jgi:hypothetical protein